ncbi:MAG: sporulation protein [Defluviitaleaceae bacterium]|nr:sporulation protein [Defluviitaleaceae bacterium]
MESKFNSNLETLFGNLNNFVSTKSVVGEPIHIGDVIMLPLIDVVFGLGLGGGSAVEKEKTDKQGAGLGAKITPSAVIVIKNNTVQLVNIKNQDAVSKLIDMAPGILSKLNFPGFDGDKKAENTPGEETVKTVKTETVTETIVTENEDNQ